MGEDRDKKQGRKHKRQWRFYKTAAGGEVVKRSLDALATDDAAEVVRLMTVIRRDGLRAAAARHLRDEIWELRASGRDVIVRLLFAKLGRFGQVLLALDVFEKKTQKTPPAKIRLAKARLKDWVVRGSDDRGKG